jgi:endonuclease-8
MPEGDTIHKLAHALARALQGAPLAGVYLRDRGEVAALRGARVERVQAVGKHMIIAFSGDRGLRIHLGMKGRWRRYPRAAGDQDGGTGAWQRLGGRASLVLATDSDAFACLHASQVELLAGVDLRRHRVLERLGPDLLAGSQAGSEVEPEATMEASSEARIDARSEARSDAKPEVKPESQSEAQVRAEPGTEIDYAEICRRARRRGHQTIAELLLDQTVASGIGNVYRSEVLFVRGVHPLTPVAQLDDQALTALYAEAARLMRANLRSGHYRITTVAPGRHTPAGPGAMPPHWVYGRHRKPCLRCGATIRVTRHGDQARATYWCPRCQTAPGQPAHRS